MTIDARDASRFSMPFVSRRTPPLTAGGYTPPDGKTITEPDDILADLAHGRDLGFFVDDEEFIDGCRCMPLTWLDETGVAAAHTITMPTSRTDERWPHSMVEQLRRLVDKMRESMGLPAEAPCSFDQRTLPAL